MPSVARRFPNSTIVCLASGPSLTQADVELCRGVVPVVAVNDTYRLAPWADALYGSDSKWWQHHAGVPSFTGEKYSVVNPHHVAPPHSAGVIVLKNTGEDGLEPRPTGLRHGFNSGYAAINLAVHLGASRILLLGYDMQVAEDGRSHFFGDHPAQDRLRVSTYHLGKEGLFARTYRKLVDPLRAMGVEVINCSRATALDCFPRQSFASALEQVAA